MILVCTACWNALAEKLKGKGRVKMQPETVFLPPTKEPEPPQTNRDQEKHQNRRRSK
jgi:hypothetical protein